MIKIIDNNKVPPLKIFKNFYDKALKKKQKNVEAMAISSFNINNNEVESRFVNLKYIIDHEWIFFSNYESQKAKDFNSHNQISALFFWHAINVQVRLKAKIIKTKESFSDKHFHGRSISKNILSIVSNQSQEIDSYKSMVKKYENYKNNQKEITRPENWGGYKIEPYYFEFWEGHESRINKREVFYKDSSYEWRKKILQP